MEEIKAGEYVRSLVNGEISKVLEVSNLLEEPNIKYYKTGKFTGFCSTEDYNVKHSSNIIDLIEKGDFVNGRLVLDVDYKNKNVCLLIPLTDTKANTNIMWYGYEDIKTVVTKEQFANAEYRLEE